MDDGRVAVFVKTREHRHGGVEREEAIKRKSGMFAGKRERELSMQGRVIGIADGGNGGETIECAAKGDHDKAGITLVGGRG